MSEEKKETIQINGQTIPKEKLEEKKKEFEEKKIKLVEVKPGQYRTKLEE